MSGGHPRNASIAITNAARIINGGYGMDPHLHEGRGLFISNARWPKHIAKTDMLVFNPATDDDAKFVESVAFGFSTTARTRARRAEVAERAARTADALGWTLTDDEQALLEDFRVGHGHA